MLPQFQKLNDQFSNSFLYKLKYDDGPSTTRSKLEEEKGKDLGNARAAYVILETINKNLNSGKR